MATNSYWKRRRTVLTNVNEHIADIERENNENLQTSPISFENDTSDLSDHADDLSQMIGDIASEPEEHADIEDELNTSYCYISDTDCGSNSSDSDNDSDSDNFVEKLSKWAVNHKTTQSSLADLLSILRPAHPELPKDPRTLLSTKTVYNIKDISGGQYYHFGISVGLKNILECEVTDLLQNTPTCIKLQINIDGLPLFKSTSHQFWPILCRVENIDHHDPFVIGLFFGLSKPCNITDYLNEFIEELNSLVRHGFQYLDQCYGIAISAFICDAPARAFVKNVKQYSGYHGCDRCIQNGVWLQKMTFPEVDAVLRTDIAFEDMLDEDHHKGPSPLTGIGIGMVSQFPLDYMHLVCLGVVKRLILLWLKGPLTCRIGSNARDAISSVLVGLRNYIPCEFSRKPRSLKEIDRWKATEFRQFLLYTGPVVLAQSLHETMYNNFMLLSVSLHILLNSSLVKQYGEYGHKLLVAFVQHFGTLYGNNMLVYNVHGLIHLAEDAKRFGSLDNISAFPFENFLSKLKGMIRKPTFPLQQVIRRLSEKTNIKISVDKYPIVKKKHCIGPLPNTLQGGDQCKSVQTEMFRLSCEQQADNCVRIGNDICKVNNIVVVESTIYVVYEVFRNVNNFFTIPLPSELLGIHAVSELDHCRHVAALSQIQCKCVLLPKGNDVYVAFPFTDSVWAVYAVVEFTDEKEVAVIPVIWMLGRTRGMWPAWKSMARINKAVKVQQEPDDSFSTLTIRVLYETDSYTKACSKLKQAEDNSDLQTEAEDTTVPAKRKKRPTSRYVDESTDDTSSPEKTPTKKRSRPGILPSMPDLPPVPAVTRMVSSTISLASVSGQTTESSVRSPPVLMSSPSTPRSSEGRPCMLGSGRASNPSTPTVSAMDKKLLTLIEEVKTQTYFNTKLLQTLLKRTEQSKSDDVIDLPDDVCFPLSTMDELDALEAKLGDDNITKSLVTQLGTIGGDTVPTCVRRILTYSLSNNLAVKFNWTGKKLKRGFSALKFMNVIARAVRKNHLTSKATDNEVSNVTKDWLRYAGDREGGRKKREEMKRQKEAAAAEVAHANN